MLGGGARIESILLLGTGFLEANDTLGGNRFKPFPREVDTPRAVDSGCDERVPDKRGDCHESGIASVVQGAEGAGFEHEALPNVQRGWDEDRADLEDEVTGALLTTAYRSL